MANCAYKPTSPFTYDEEVAQTIYRVLPEYAELLRRLLAKLREAEQRRAEESAG